MSSPVTDLEAGLTAMQNLKPPGVSGSRIQSLTQLCVDNVQSEEVLVAKIYTHFKKAPATHKLGVLYVVDSVTRKWVDQAKHQGQPINGTAPYGTYAAGVDRVTQLLPNLMSDILDNAPGEQKEKIKKLIDIWEKGQTFPQPLIESFKKKLNSLQNESTTPVGSPPPGPGLPGLPEKKSPPSEAPAPNAVLDALAKMARQNEIARQNAKAAAPVSNGVPPNYNAPPAQISTPQLPTLPLNQTQPPAQYSTPQQAMNVPGMPYAFPQPGQVMSPMTANNPVPGYPGVAPGAPSAPINASDPNVQQQVMLIKLLADRGIPIEQIPALIASIQTNGVAPPAPAPAVTPAPAGLPYGASPWGQGGFRPEDARDHGFQQVRSPNRYRNRSRSRSPPRHWGARDSPRGRSDRDFGYGRNSPGLDRERGRAADYRQRSPERHDRSESPAIPPPPAQKWVDYDRSLQEGHIKVLSRTLFVGGVQVPESELHNAFSRHGHVQSCIVNKDKRHAFVKMVTRKDAENAKKAMENSPFRTRWGVGYGPRDCSDYSCGVSIIPIDKLTEADRKWMLTAPYGGSGGVEIETGMVVEEPDIEIGAGVSSKAISRRMATDKGGRHGPKSSRGHSDDDGEHGGGRWRRARENQNRREEHGGQQPDPRMAMDVNNGPAIPSFPFGISTGPNGMPVFPPGFAFPPPQTSGQ